MKKSQLEYMCFCLFVIVVCISIILFTSNADSKMKLVSEDLDNYIIEPWPPPRLSAPKTAAFILAEEEEIIREKKAVRTSIKAVASNISEGVKREASKIAAIAEKKAAEKKAAEKKTAEKKTASNKTTTTTISEIKPSPVAANIGSSTFKCPPIKNPLYVSTFSWSQPSYN
jgi:hypothetical protein